MAVSARKLFRPLAFAALAVAASLVAVPAAFSAGDAAKPTDSQSAQFYDQQVKPILEHACFKCHGGEAKIKGGLRLTTRAGLLKGGDTAPALDAAHPDKSL